MIDKVNFYLHKSNQFPTLPTIYSSLMIAVSSPRTTIQDLADIIIKDQASVVTLLKVVNSPIYGLQGTITTLKQAIFYLGFAEVKNLLLSLSVMNIFERVNSSEKFNIIDLWKHSLAVGVISRLIAKKLNLKDTENYFIAGIIHDIGKLFFLHFFDEVYYKAIEKAQSLDLKLTDIEKKVFGMNHCEVGAELAIKWSLPEELQKIILNHEGGVSLEKTNSLLAVIHLSNMIANMMQLGYSANDEIIKPSFEIWSVINLPKGTFQALYSDIINNYNSANSILTLK